MGIIEKVYAAFDQDVISVGTNSSVNSVGGLVDTVVKWVSLIIGALAFFYLIYGAILYITAGGNPESAKKGQQTILYAIIGIVIAVLAYSIVAAIGGTFKI